MRRERSPLSMLALAGGVIAAILVGGALVGVRGEMNPVNVALVLVLVVVAAAAIGGRLAGAATAVAATLAFDFFHTQPYYSLRIFDGNDLETTLLLLAVGLVAGELATRGRRSHASATARSKGIRRIHRVAELAATGEHIDDLIASVCVELTAELRLADCRFEAEPVGPRLPQIERSGALHRSTYRYTPDGFVLPEDGVEIAVMGRGRNFGRLVMLPELGVGISLDERVVAVALADQLGAALAARATPGQSTSNR